MEVKGTKIASIDDVVSVLEKDKSGELTYEQQLALQHAKKFSTTKQKGEKLRKELESTGTLSERSVIKILEVMPKNKMTLRQVLAHESKVYSDEDLDKILAITKDKG